MAYTIEQLTKVGGSFWQDDQGERRVYFNDIARRVGLEYTRHKTGSMSSVKYRGEFLSNNKGKMLVVQADLGKLYYDLNLGQFFTKGLPSDWSEIAISSVIAEVEA